MKNRFDQANGENENLIKNLEEKESSIGHKEEFFKDIYLKDQKNKDLEDEIEDLNTKLNLKKAVLDNMDSAWFMREIQKIPQENEEQNNFLK